MTSAAVSAGGVLGGTQVQASPYAQPSNRRSPYRVRVFNEGLYRQLAQQHQEVGTRGGKPSSPSGSYGRSINSKHSHFSTQLPSESRIEAGIEAKKTRLENQYRQQLAQQQQMQARLLKDKLVAAAAKTEREFLRLAGHIVEGHRFVDELDRTLGIADERERSKKLKQFEEWDTNVHRVTQGGIEAALKEMSSKQINEHRRSDLQKFLTTTNAKAAIFRDIIIESEYDPLEPNRRAIKARVGHLRDPCSRVLHKRLEENGLLTADEGGDRAVSLVKETLHVELWADGRIRDTPHGFFAKMMNRENKQSKAGGEKTTSKTYKSSIKIDDYNIDRGRDIVTKEFPKGKKTYKAGDDFAPPTRDSQLIIGMGS